MSIQSTPVAPPPTSSRRTPSRQDHDAREAAHGYLGRGWQPVPIERGVKGPRTKRWQRRRFAQDEIDGAFSPDSNVGLLCGKPSNGLVDVDLDAPEAILVAPELLPPTGMRHGRPGKPESHAWFVCDPCPSKTKEFKDLNGTMLVEVRSTGGQTLVPPSVHPSGERISFSATGEPATVDRDVLTKVAATVAVAAIVARHYPPQGSRHATALAFAGLLLRGGMGVVEAEQIIRAAATAAGDEEVEDRVAAVKTTAAKLEKGDAVTGGPTFADLLTGEGERVVARVRDWLGLRTPWNAPGASGLPIIEADDLVLTRVSQLAWDAITSAPESDLYRQGTVITQLVSTEDDRLVMAPVQPDDLRHQLARAITWVKTKSGRHVPALPPSHVVRDMLAEPSKPLRPLVRIVGAPVVAKDGTIHLTPGYSAVTRAFYAPAADLSLPEVPDHPTPDQIRQAVDLLRNELLGQFPFDSESDLANTVAFVIAPFVRDLILGPTPLHLFEKPTPGTGGTLLVEAISNILLGRFPTALTESTGEGEWRKRLTAVLLEAPSLLVLENLTRPLNSAALAAALTATIWSDRILGMSRVGSVPVSTIWAATGNNPTLSSEIARRTVPIRLDAKMDRPWLRTGFRYPNLVAWVHDQRGHLIWSVLVLVRAWVIAGRPLASIPFGSYESYAATLGGILAVAGIGGFLANRDRFYHDADLEGESWRSFFGAWWDLHRDHPVGVQTLWHLVAGTMGDPLDLGLGEGSDRSIKTALGKQLAKRRDCRFGALRLVRAGTVAHARQWRLIRDDDTVDVPTPSSEEIDVGDSNDGEDEVVDGDPDPFDLLDDEFRELFGADAVGGDR